MNRQEKTKQIEDIKSQFQKTSIILLADYRGLKANEMNQLRNELRKQAAVMKVLKNTLAKIAVDGLDSKPLQEHFENSMAVITTEGDPVAAAKVLVEFSKKFEKPKLKKGFMSGSLMGESDIEALSKLPSREELLAKLLGSMQAPAQNLVNVFAAIPRQLVTVLAAVRDKKSN